LPNEIEPFHLSTKEVKQISARSKGKRRLLIAGLAAIGLEAAKRFQFPLSRVVYELAPRDARRRL
jgi:hypothetical protein